MGTENVWERVKKKPRASWINDKVSHPFVYNPAVLQPGKSQCIGMQQACVPVIFAIYLNILRGKYSIQ